MCFVLLYVCALTSTVNPEADTIMLMQNVDSLHRESVERAAAYEFEEAISISRAALTIGSTLPEPDRAALILYDIGENYYELCAYDSSLCYLDSAFVLARLRKNKDLECRILNKVGEIHERMSQHGQALILYDSALTLATAVENKHVEGLVLCNIGWTYDAVSDYERALMYHDSACVIARSIGDRRLEGCILRRIGTTLSVLGQFDRSLAYYDSALVIALETNDRRLEGRTLMGIGRIRFALDDYGQTLAINRQALDIMRATKDRVFEGYVLDCSGMAHRFRCEYDSALVYHRAALAVRRQVKDRLGEGNALVNLGLTYIDQYRYEEALAYLDSGLVIAKAINNNTGKGTIYISLGSTFDDLARYDKALAYYDSALIIARKTGEKMKEGTLLMYIGGVYHDLKQYERALLYYDSARVYVKELGIHYVDALILVYTGAACRALRQYNRALSVYDSALVSIRAINEHRLEGVILHNIGSVYCDLGQYDAAYAYLDSAFSAVDKVHNLFRKAAIWSQKGTIHRMRGQYDRALAYYDSALAMARKIRDQSTEGTTLHSVGQLYEQLGDVDKAIASYKQAIEVKESIREAFQRVDLKTYYIEAERDAYEQLIILLIMLERYEEAFDYLERSRSQKLRKAFEQGEMVAYDPSLQRMLERINFLSIEMEGFRMRYQRGEIDELTYEKNMDELEGRLNQKLVDLKIYHPQLYNLMIPQHRMLRQIRETIPDSVLFLEYLAVGDTYVVLLFAKNLFLAQSRAEPKDSIDKLVMQALTSLKWQARQEELVEMCSLLYDILIEPSEQQIAKFQHVVIIPYGILHYLPFHTLRCSNEDGDMIYFLERKQISYLPSASFLIDLLRGKDHADLTLLAFGNADGTLPSAEIEVDAIARLFPRCSIFKCERARKDRFIELCTRYRLIHLATHGVLSADPRFSHIVLAPPQEGNLTVREILGLSGHFKLTSLVTLSACETAVEADPETAGLELITFSNAFKVAGVPTIVASLWEIADRSTARLMEEFYRNLYSRNLSKLEALRQAQISMIRHANYSHPYYWAPFILIGSWE